MKSPIVFAVLLAVVAADGTSYYGYKVYHVTPKTGQEMQFLISLLNYEGYDFWSEPRTLGKAVSVMISPPSQNKFVSLLQLIGMEHTVRIENVESTIQFERLRQTAARRVGGGRISFAEYNRYDDIQGYLAQLAQNYPDIVSLENIGTSYEGRPMTVIKIGSGGSDKPAILVDGGIHAREWISPAFVLYIIHELVQNFANRALIETTNWYIIPVLNPDGYEYTHTNDRLWRKTRSRRGYCYGVDPNRNFDFHWMESGASSDTCSELYAGPRAFSEAETIALRDFVLKEAFDIKLYLTFHSYGQHILYPWGYTSALPDNALELHYVADYVSRAISSVAGTQYTIGSSTNVLAAGAGGSDDWVKGVGNVKLAYTIELPDGGEWGFDLPDSRILDVCKETWEGILVYQKYIEKKFAHIRINSASQDRQIETNKLKRIPHFNRLF